MNRSWKKLLLKALNPLDYAARVLNNKTHLPPLDLRWDVGPLKNFESSAAEFRVYLKMFGGLVPNARFLDIGCGCGQIAIEMKDQLDEQGEYVGCDINKGAINWCNRGIADSDARFSFFHMDVKNGMYNPSAKDSASQYQFPEIGLFNLILLKSVFTHMMKDEVENYLAQLPRLLEKDGRCVATFFLMNSNHEQRARAGKSLIKFHQHDDAIAFADPLMPEAIVAFNEDRLLQMIHKSGLEVISTHYGSWSGNKSGVSHQDILILGRLY